MIKGGLQLLPKDHRDFQLGFITTLPKLKDLPGIFTLGNTIIRHQAREGNSDFCTAYSTVGMAYLEDGIEGSVEWSFAASKEISGDNEQFGQNMRTAMKTWRKYGSPPRDKVKIPAQLNHRRYLSNYADFLKQEARILKKKAYVSTKGPYNAFDNIRASIWKYREEKRAVGIGLVFAWPVQQEYLETIKDGGFGHMMFVTGWKPDYLEVVNSYGKGAGKDGKHWISKEVIEHFVKRYGAFMLIDADPNKLKVQQTRAEWYKASWLRKLRIIMRNLTV